jgi:multicomponent Na+:H+ antiporter subunit E
MIGNIILRLVIWFLLTANFSLANIIIGISIAFLLPRDRSSPERLKDLLPALGKILMAIPQAYMEAFELIFRPHTEEEIVMEKSHTRRSPGLVFLNIFLITFTPKTIVLKHHEDGLYEVHHVHRRKRS